MQSCWAPLVCAARDVHPANVAAKVGETVTLQCSKSSASYIQVCVASCNYIKFCSVQLGQ